MRMHANIIPDFGFEPLTHETPQISDFIIPFLSHRWVENVNYEKTTNNIFSIEKNEWRYLEISYVTTKIMIHLKRTLTCLDINFSMLAMVAVPFDAPDKFTLFLGYDLMSGKSFQSALSIFTVNGPF